MDIKHPRRGILTKAYDFGTNDPFGARMMFQIFHVRDLILENDDRKTFDKLYEPFFQNLIEAKKVKENSLSLIDKHIEDIDNEIAVKIDNELIRVDTPIDDDLNIWFKDFFIRGRMAMNCISSLTTFLGHNIYFIFASEKKYQEKLKKFKQTNEEEKFNIFFEFVDANRLNWLNAFIKIRDDIEHKGIRLPVIKYGIKNGKIEPRFPVINKLEINDLLKLLWDNLFSFCEEILIFFMSLKLSDDLLLVEIKEKDRAPELPIKYNVIPKFVFNNGMKIDVSRFRMQ